MFNRLRRRFSAPPPFPHLDFRVLSPSFMVVPFRSDVVGLQSSKALSLDDDLAVLVARLARRAAVQGVPVEEFCQVMTQADFIEMTVVTRDLPWQTFLDELRESK